MKVIQRVTKMIHVTNKTTLNTARWKKRIYVAYCWVHKFEVKVLLLLWLMFICNLLLSYLGMSMGRV